MSISFSRLHTTGDEFDFLHDLPLHSSPAGLRFGRTAGTLAVTEAVSDRIVRLPLAANLTQTEVDTVISIVSELLLGTENCSHGADD